MMNVRDRMRRGLAGHREHKIKAQQQEQRRSEKHLMLLLLVVGRRGH